METTPRHMVEAGRYVGFHPDRIMHHPLAFAGISI
jgi:hypothetical protein